MESTNTANHDSSCDILIRNATIIDGSGGPGIKAGVAVTGDTISSVGALQDLIADIDIDAQGLLLTPGFIDTHAHDDAALIDEPAMEMKISQGVTSVVIGNCGISLAPLTAESPLPSESRLFGKNEQFKYPEMEDYFSTLGRHPTTTNVAALVGHLTLRVDTLENLERPANSSELSAMQEKLDRTMKAGALGFSTGVFYSPSSASTKEEAASLARVVGAHKGIYATQIRDEADDIVESLDEAFAVATEGDVPLVISHHKVAGKNNFGRTRETLELIEQYSNSHTVSFDVYPYTAASSHLHPDYAKYTDKILITNSVPHPELIGKDVASIASEWNCTIREAMEEMQPGAASYFIMDEAEVQRVLSHSMAMIGSDGVPGEQHPHPRLWGTFPRVISHYARYLGLFTISEAIRRMTSLPARSIPPPTPSIIPH